MKQTIIRVCVLGMISTMCFVVLAYGAVKAVQYLNSFFNHNHKNMPAEIKSKGVKVETTVSKTLRDRFKRHCKKLNVSVSQHLRDLMQLALKAK